MKTNFKAVLLAVPFLFIISCSDSNEVQESKIEAEESKLAWDATNYIMYNEFLQCSAGEAYSQEALDEMVKEWRDLDLPESMLGAWGYSSLNDENKIIITEWELSWSSQEEADLAWEAWSANDNARAWSEKHAQVLQCDSEARDGYEFMFPFNPYAFGPTPDTGSFVATFTPCNLNEGMSNDDLSNEIIKFNNLLEKIDPKMVSNFYAYGIYFPLADSSEEDFWYGNFFGTLETISDINNAWEQFGEEADNLNEEISSCGDPVLTNGQVFYDPTNPDFS
tara:strand:- start:379 stop:1215 length:837 start_codon:yes stop_codon:yes gene_type:complete